MKNILLIAHFTQAPGEKGNGRFVYIAEMLEKRGHKVEVVTTNFSHEKKEHRDLVIEQPSYAFKYKLTMIQESGYKKNVSLKRLYSHFTFGRNLKEYLKKRAKPDLIYCAVPSLDASYIAAKYAKENNIRFIIDIQDIWPEAFKMVFHFPPLTNVIYSPMNKKAEFIYHSADQIVAVSDTYLQRALMVNERCQKGLSVYLGTDLSFFDRLANKKELIKPKDECWIVYIGTLGHSYDLNCVIDALHILKLRNHTNFKLIVMGDGPLRIKFEKYARDKEIYHEFMGLLAYEEMVKILVQCDIAVNPITKGTAGSIINKVGDYAAAGLPVINTQECIEYQQLLSSYHAGMNCTNGNPKEFADYLLFLSKDEKERSMMGKNNRKLAEDKFDRKKTYDQILQLIND